MSAKESISKVLQYEIAKQNYSIKDIADCIGVSVKTLKGYLSGITLPRLATILLICDKFNITTDYLLGLKDEFGNEIL